MAVTDNQAVHAGDLLVKLDDRDYRAALAKAVAAVAGQQATLANLDATRRLQEAMIARGPGRASPPPTRRSIAPATIRSAIASFRATAAASLQRFQKADADYKKARRRRRAGRAPRC